MNKRLFTLLFVLAGFTSGAQNVLALVIGSVTDSSGNPVAGHPVTLTATPTPGTAGVAITAQLITSANGYFGDSLLLPGVTGTLVLSTADCNGATLSNTFSYSPNSGSVMTVNSPFVLCAAGSGGGGGTPLTCDAL
ncbi:MAG: carboxypeptidase-like regulatory domain-containing protein, partial [Schleiferiaceae bacterium]